MASRPRPTMNEVVSTPAPPIPTFLKKLRRDSDMGPLPASNGPISAGQTLEDNLVRLRNAQYSGIEAALRQTSYRAAGFLRSSLHAYLRAAPEGATCPLRSISTLVDRDSTGTGRLDRRTVLAGALGFGARTVLHGWQDDRTGRRPAVGDFLVKVDDATLKPLGPDDIPLQSAP